MKAPSLIPFVVGLIGYESCLKDSPDNWKHGPEYIFRVGVNSSLLIPDKNNFLCSNVTIALKCRPFSSTSDDRVDGLQCYVRDAQITNYKVLMNEKPSKIVQDDPPSPFLFGDRKFEIIYDKKGIKHIEFESSITPWHLNMLRAVANQLNIGFDRFDKGGERFAVVEVVGYENSTIGECETKFEVSKQTTDRVKNWQSKKCENKIHLETYAYGSKNPMIAIDKIRDTDKCLTSTPYVFGAVEVKKDKETVVKIKMTSSVTSFLVGPMSFQSQTRNLATENMDNGTVIGPSEEAIDLVLESIDPAESEFKRIERSGVTIIYANAPIVHA